MSGPLPKRSEERRRRNKDAIPVTKIDLDSLIAADVEVPDTEEGWHPIVRNWYDSLKASGQAIFYEPSDWATALVLAEQLDRMLQPVPIVVQLSETETEVQMHEMPIKGADMTAWLKGSATLMTTEGSRRLVRIELERKKARDAIAGGDGKVVSITQHRAGLFS